MVRIEKVLMGLGNFVLDVEAKQTQIFVSGDEIKKDLRDVARKS